ncbi:TetR family transcriptional regulator [Amycolatopsis acidicola]|uniref:TetR family transcriptional regulator n=1 Tax=Amycolatopsis acidicola TaxID=2596893 RepID=A0A5N0UUF5_9PSEU|nr:TetR/AcrR family transcriptional regulator [Amycolatopsis acidicola]KAA9153876.1 TetR family transcriptional regulator [Amycolatopsis acidicola]
MPRWEPDGVGRLQNAALELFAEQGFERTTVAEIAERAGLTKRTFFNHFADKREVLFGRAAEYQREIILRELGESPDDVPPLDAVVRGLQAAADEMFEGNRDDVMRRGAIIEANPELHERELRKRAALTDTLAEALRARGVDADTALLTAQAGALVQQTAMQRWLQSAEKRPLRELFAEALASLRAVAGTANP